MSKKYEMNAWEDFIPQDKKIGSKEMRATCHAEIKDLIRKMKSELKLPTNADGRLKRVSGTFVLGFVYALTEKVGGLTQAVTVVREIEDEMLGKKHEKQNGKIRALQTEIDELRKEIRAMREPLLQR